MEFEFLSKNLEWEKRRIAAAFGLSEFEGRVENQGYDPHFYLQGEIHVEVATRKGKIDLLQIGGKQGHYCEVFQNFPSPEWNVVGEPQEMRHEMARGLYRLGMEDEEVLFQLNSLLTAHEKMELRLSLPREFWPQTWLDEEKAGPTETL